MAISLGILNRIYKSCKDECMGMTRKAVDDPKTTLGFIVYL